MTSLKYQPGAGLLQHYSNAFNFKWLPGASVPGSLRERWLAEYEEADQDQCHVLDHGPGIATANVSSERCALLATSGIDWHTDGDFLPWSVLLVLSNADLVIQSKNTHSSFLIKNPDEAVPKGGDIVVLQTTKMHRVKPIGRAKCYPDCRIEVLSLGFWTVPSYAELAAELKRARPKLLESQLDIKLV